MIWQEIEINTLQDLFFVEVNSMDDQLHEWGSHGDIPFKSTTATDVTKKNFKNAVYWQIDFGREDIGKEEIRHFLHIFEKNILKEGDYFTQFHMNIVAETIGKDTRGEDINRPLIVVNSIDLEGFKNYMENPTFWSDDTDQLIKFWKIGGEPLFKDTFGDDWSYWVKDVKKAIEVREEREERRKAAMRRRSPKCKMR